MWRSDGDNGRDRNPNRKMKRETVMKLNVVEKSSKKDGGLSSSLREAIGMRLEEVSERKCGTRFQKKLNNP